MKKIKTVLLSHLPIPYNGIASWTSMFNFLLRNQNNVDYVICPFSGETVKHTKQLFIKPSKSILSKLKVKYFYEDKNIAHLKLIADVLKKEGAIIIQIIDNIGILKSVQKYIRKNNLKNQVYLQFHYHGFLPFCKEDHLLFEDLDEIVLLTKLSYDKFKEINSLPIKVSINHNGVDSQKFKPLILSEKKQVKESLGLKDSKIVFSWCSQDRKKKGLDIILEVWSKIIDDYEEEVELLVIGAKHQKVIKGVRWVGRVPNDTLPKYFQVSDVFLFPTLCQEGFGLSLVEALKCGNICIASSIGGVPEVLNNGQLGILVEDPHLIVSWVSVLKATIEKIKKNKHIIEIDSKELVGKFEITDWALNYNKNINDIKRCFKNRYYV